MDKIITHAKEIRRPDSEVTKEEKEYFIPAEIKPGLKKERLIHLFEKNEGVNIMQFQDNYFYFMYESDGEQIMPGVTKRKIPNVCMTVYITCFILDYLLPAVRLDKEFQEDFWSWMEKNDRMVFMDDVFKRCKDDIALVKFDVDLKYNCKGIIAIQNNKCGHAGFSAGPIPARLLLADEIQFCREIIGQ